MVYVKIENGYGGVFTKENFLLGEMVYHFSPTGVTEAPTRTSIQVGIQQHIEDEVGQYVNHNCIPSCEVTSQGIRALKDIKEGEEITFDYNSNEDVMANPFKCNCCGKMIKGKNCE